MSEKTPPTHSARRSTRTKHEGITADTFSSASPPSILPPEDDFLLLPEAEQAERALQMREELKTTILGQILGMAFPVNDKGEIDLQRVRDFRSHRFYQEMRNRHADYVALLLSMSRADQIQQDRQRLLMAANAARSTQAAATAPPAVPATQRAPAVPAVPPPSRSDNAGRAHSGFVAEVFDRQNPASADDAADDDSEPEDDQDWDEDDEGPSRMQRIKFWIQDFLTLEHPAPDPPDDTSESKE